MSFSFNGNTPKSIIFNNQEVKKLIYNNDVVWQKSSFDEEYQRLTYIESTGTQRININVSLQTDDKIIAKASSLASTAYGSIYGVSNFCQLYFNDSYRVVAWKNCSIISDVGDVGQGEVHTIVSRITANQYSNLVLFDYLPNSTKYPLTGRLYAFTIIRDNEIIYNFIPCYRKSDGEVGLYDIINDNFYVNLGTGTFIKGIEPVELPSEYQQVEYIESTGNQYINTGIPINIIGTNDCNFKLRFAFISSTAGGTLMGANNAAKQMVTTRQRIRWDWVKGTSTGSFKQNLSVDIPYIIEQKNGYLICEDTSMEIETQATSTLPCGLFARLDNSTGTLSNNRATARIYNFYAESNGIDICNIIPCYRKSDDEIGMYDLVNNVFYTNSGTDAFIKGLDVN